jgi:hypothetical protein
MSRLNLIVEGPSEETFVRRVLAPYLGEHGVYASARSVETSRSLARVFRGGLLFSDVGAIDSELIDHPSDTQLVALRHIRDGFESPEHINDGYKTCPSRRICSLFPRYQKVTDGVRIAERIGVEEIRRNCAHFDTWISRLLLLALEPSSQTV